MKRVLPLNLLDEEDVKETIVTKKTRPVIIDSEEEESTIVEEGEELSESQIDALNLIKRGMNVFITGSAGTGKSFLLKRIVEFLESAQMPFDVTASTGVAAWQIGGTTLHSFAGIGLGTDKMEVIIEKLMKRRDKVTEWRNIKTLIIDEISMITVKFMQTLDVVAKTMRKTQRPFGGIQVIMIGDYFQLPSVEKDLKPDKARFLFQSSLWNELNIRVVLLKQNFRQAGDDKFIQLLERVKIGNISTQDESLLRTRLIDNHSGVDKSSLIRLCSKRITAEIINRSELEKIKSPSMFYKGILTYYDINGIVIDAPTKTTTDEKKDHYPVDMDIELKVGAEVILCCNLDKDNGLFNGCRGTVMSFRREDGAGVDAPLYPVVQFEHGYRTIIKPNQWETRRKRRITSTFLQVPLILRYAITIHRAQGLTLSKVLITMDFFEFGQGYVALSRVRSLDDLYLTNINVKKFLVSSDVIDFYNKHYSL
jgi:ATP-dependent DNA helicase PIF1